jgi:RNA polymerase sigma-70 factor (ECF subfamily)
MSIFTAAWPKTENSLWLSKRKTVAAKHAEFEALVAKDWERFWRFAYRLTGDRDLAEDLISETLIDAFSGFDRFRGDKFDSWFFKMLTTNRIDMARKAKRRQADSLETAFSESEGRDIADKRPTPEAELMNPLYSEPVQKAIDALPEDFRTAVLLADVEGYDYSEIAAILNVPIGTVRSRISRGRERLRAMLS